MTINFHRTESPRAIFAAFCHTLGFKFTLGLTALALCVDSATSQALRPSGTPPNTKSYPIREGSQPFAITMGADGNFWFTLSNSNEVARITPRGKFIILPYPDFEQSSFHHSGPRRQHLVRRRGDREDCIGHTNWLDTNQYDR